MKSRHTKLKGRSTKSKGRSLHYWRVAKEKALAELRGLEVDQLRGRLVDVDEFAKRYEKIALEMVRIIKSSSMTEEDQRKTLTALAAVHKK